MRAMIVEEPVLARKISCMLEASAMNISVEGCFEEEMDALVKEYIEKYAKDYEGYFLMGPNMLNDTSKPELVKTWMNAMKKYGTCR